MGRPAQSRRPFSETLNVSSMSFPLPRSLKGLLPERLKRAIKQRVSRRFHGQPRARFTFNEQSGELRIAETYVLLPGRSESNWFANHPEDVLELEVFLKLSKEAKGVMLDIGAYKGLFASLFCKVSKHGAIAFEPAPRSQELIKRTITLNDLGNRIELVGAALGKGAEVTNLQLDPSTGFAQIRNHESSGGSSDITILAPSTTVDKFRSAAQKKIGILKIDVEGAEDEVLEGSYQTLRQDRPVVLVEIHNDCLAQRGVNFRQVLGRVVEQGYSLMRLNGRHATPGSATRAVHARVHLLAIPREECARYRVLLQQEESGTFSP